ncbi:hypothetical protein STENM223S_07692 [Streptomyces tendae]
MAGCQVVEAVGDLPFGPAHQGLVVTVVQGEAEDFVDQKRVCGRRAVLVHPLGEAGGAQEKLLIEVDGLQTQLVQPVHGLGAGSQRGVVEVEAVGGAEVAGAGGQFPPELGALGVVGEVEHAAEELGAVDVEVCEGRAYANDQGAQTSLAAVTARSNRSKADQDPAQWMPPAAAAHCRYIAEWIGTKLRWSLTADETEVAALRDAAGGCPSQQVTWELAA